MYRSLQSVWSRRGLVLFVLVAGLAVDARADHRVGVWNADDFRDDTSACIELQPLSGRAAFVEIESGCDGNVEAVPENCSPYECRVTRPIPVGDSRQLRATDVGIDPHELSDGDTARGTIELRLDGEATLGRFEFESTWTFREYSDGCGCSSVGGVR